MDFKLRMAPLEEGGTAVIDYDPAFHHMMEESIVHCGREDLILCSVPSVHPGQYSMHLISDNNDLTNWWDSVKIISEKYAN